MTGTVRYPRPKGLLFVITVMLLIGFASLVLSVQNAIAISRQADQRNEDRIAADLAGCERGNVFRQQVIDQAKAVDQLMTGILDLAFTPPTGVDPTRAEYIRQFRARFDGPVAAYRKATTSIRLVDCRAVTPGATTPTSR